LGFQVGVRVRVGLQVRVGVGVRVRVANLHEGQPAREPAERGRVQVGEEVLVTLGVADLPVEAG